MSREIIEAVVIIAAWSSGTWLLYAWASLSGSWLQRLDGGRVKRAGNVYGVLGFYSVAMGVALGVVVHQFAIGLSLGFVVGLTLGRKLTCRIVMAQRDLSVPPSSREIPGVLRGARTRPFALIYGVCSASVIITCLWLYYGEGMRAWITVLAGAAGLGEVTVLVWCLRLLWKRKTRQVPSGPGGGASQERVATVSGLLTVGLPAGRQAFAANNKPTGHKPSHACASRRELIWEGCSGGLWPPVFSKQRPAARGRRYNFLAALCCPASFFLTFPTNR